MTTLASAPPNIRDSPRATDSSVPRFTRDGDAALECHLERTCDRVMSGIRGLVPAKKIEAVLLGGGYGRGEGGVLRTPDGDRPYNDLEFYVLLRGNRHLNELRYRHRLEVFGEILTHLAGVEVEFKISSLAELAARPVSMFSYDLISGHRLIGGKGNAFPDLGHHRRAEDIPADEATRLLMNRCTGLLFAAAELGREPFTLAAADFVRRNIAKAQLALGDAALAERGLYHWSCLERHRRLQALAREESSPWLDAVLRHHVAGVDFKLHPESGGLPHHALSALHREITALALESWLRLESARLGHPFHSAREYAAFPDDKCPDTPPWRNLAQNLRVDRFHLPDDLHPWRHPRQRVFNSLALLLWEPAVFVDPTLRRRLEAELNSPAPRLAPALVAYRELWSRVR